jgi:hypothetical protein
VAQTLYRSAKEKYIRWYRRCTVRPIKVKMKFSILVSDCNFLYISHVPCVCYTPTHLTLLDFITLIIFVVKKKEVLEESIQPPVLIYMSSLHYIYIFFSMALQPIFEPCPPLY